MKNTKLLVQRIKTLSRCQGNIQTYFDTDYTAAEIDRFQLQMPIETIEPMRVLGELPRVLK